MPTTTNFSLPYPQSSDSVDVPRDIGALASAVDTRLLNTIRVFASTAARDSAIPSPAAGMVVYINSDDANEGFYFHTGSAWLKGATWNSPWGVVGYAERTTNQTGIGTSVTDLTSLSVTWTAVANRRYMVRSFVNLAQGSTATVGTVVIRTGGNVQLQSEASNTLNTIISTAFQPVTSYTPAAGSQTVKMSASVNAGTGNSNNSSTNPSWILVEDIGPTGAPA